MIKESFSIILSFLLVGIKMRYGYICHPFIPFIICFIDRPFALLLWVGVLSGFVIDLFSSYPFGLITGSYVITLLLLQLTKKKVYEITPWIFLQYALSYGAVLSLMQLLLFSLYKKTLFFTFSTLLLDCLVYPFLDAFVGFLVVYFPLWVFEQLKKKTPNKQRS